MRSMIALVIDAPLQVIEARHGNVEVSLSACWVAAAWTLIVYSNDHLTTSGGGQQNAISAVKEVVAGGSGPVH